MASGGSSESVVVAQCLEWLALHRVFAWRHNTGAYRTPTGAFIRYGHPGSADIIGLMPGGRFLAVECKTASGKQRKAQQVFEQMVTQSGGLYILARSTADLERHLVPPPHFAP